MFSVYHGFTGPEEVGKGEPIFMKFQSLTITLTLVGLSVVAICALGVLPIDEMLVDTASGAQYEYHENYDTSMERGYNISISVSAGSCGASASVSPALMNPGRFNSEEDTKDWFGHAITYAQRDAYTKVTVSIPTGRSGRPRRGGRTSVRQVSYTDMPEKIDQTDRNASDIQAQVKLRGEWEGEITIPEGGGTLTLNVGLEHRGLQAGGTYEHKGKSVKVIKIRVLVDTTELAEDSYGRSSSAETTDPYHPPIDCEASATEIRFAGSSFSSREEEYIDGATYGFIN